MDKQEKIEYVRQMIAEYPFIDPRNGNEMYDDLANFDYSYTWLDDLPDGWQIGFGKQLCEEIKQALIEDGTMDSYQIVQVKEKYGSLRWYDNGVCDKIQSEIIPKYERISAKMCVVCGKPARYMSTGWVCPYCSEHLPQSKESALFIGEGGCMVGTLEMLNKAPYNEYVVESITLRNPDHYNRWHQYVLGKICQVCEYDADMHICVLYVCFGTGLESLHLDVWDRYYLSRMEDCVEAEDGTLTITTRNSVYVLKPTSNP